MGEYGAYVWPAYGIAALLFIGLIIDSVHRRRTNLKRLDQMKAMRGDRRRREPPA
ncbi:MAG: heme exporter protein CcmD, partial [Rhodospirillaceae bacterium]